MEELLKLVQDWDIKIQKYDEDPGPPYTNLVGPYPFWVVHIHGICFDGELYDGCDYCQEGELGATVQICLIAMLRRLKEQRDGLTPAP